MRSGVWPQPGEEVRIRQEGWRVIAVTTYGDCALLTVTRSAPDAVGARAHFLLPFERVSPKADSSEQPALVRPGRARHIARSVLAAAAPSWTSLRAAGRARITLLPYQLEPVLAMTHVAGCRFLIADAVGLGKTVQAGLMVAELLAREHDARVLIVTPAALREQWRNELQQRFGIEADVLDAAGLARAAGRLPWGANPWALSRVGIASIDFLKRAGVIRSLERLVWDLMVFDEAHALSGASDRATAAALLACRARRLVLLTATPHSGDADAFDRLCALGRLDDEPLLLFRRTREDAGVPGTRKLGTMRVRCTPDEARMHETLAAYARQVSRRAPSDAAPGARLVMTILARRACSSAASLARSVTRRMVMLAGCAPGGAAQLRLPLDDAVGDEPPEAELGAPGLADVAEELRWLRRILALAEAASARESKVAHLRRLLRRVNEPLLVFTEYRDTLTHLADALGDHGGIEQLHGGMDARERTLRTRAFTQGTARLLLATDAAGEGLNLHARCRLVVNLEVPWTPLRLEQRVGRVDRLGQSRTVHAIALIAAGTLEEDTLARLGGRIRRVRDAENALASSGSGVPPHEASIDIEPLPGGVRPVSFRAQAEQEVTRLRLSRALALSHAAGSPRPARAPAAILVKPQAAGRLYCAVRLSIVDEAGNVLWEPIRAVCLPAPTPVPRGRRRELRDWLRRAVTARGVELAAAVAPLHLEELETAALHVTAHARLLARRERAIAEQLGRMDARLAAHLVQPGLFDRRSARQAAAQARLAQEAARRSEERLAALERMSRLAAGGRHLAFLLVVPRR